MRFESHTIIRAALHGYQRSSAPAFRSHSKCLLLLIDYGKAIMCNQYINTLIGQRMFTLLGSLKEDLKTSDCIILPR